MIWKICINLINISRSRLASSDYEKLFIHKEFLPAIRLAFNNNLSLHLSLAESHENQFNEEKKSFHNILSDVFFFLLEAAQPGFNLAVTLRRILHNLRIFINQALHNLVFAIAFKVENNIFIKVLLNENDESYVWERNWRTLKMKERSRLLDN